WFRQARFGMFIHWGLYAQLGRHEWAQELERWPRKLYEPLAVCWHPQPGCQREWAKLAKQAGCRYMVMTTKHHEGFCLFNTATTDYNAVQRGPGRDLWAKWQALGQDKASVVADPVFVAPGKHDYTLQKSSPAFKLGFKPIDLSSVGNYASPERRTWPRPEVKVFREPADYSPRREAAAQPARRDYEDYAVGDGERGAAVGEAVSR
ncbi:MAG: alpha-L-fucosidase, partial [bacterium]